MLVLTTKYKVFSIEKDVVTFFFTAETFFTPKEAEDYLVKMVKKKEDIINEFHMKGRAYSLVGKEFVILPVFTVEYEK